MNRSTCTQKPSHHIGRISKYAAALTALIVLGGCQNRVLLDERFFDTRLVNWTVVDDPDTLEGPSEWRVESDGWLHQKSNIWGLRGDFIGRWYGTYLIAGDTSWKDYTMTLTARPTDDDGFGVVFRYQDSEHFYRLLFLEDGLSGGPLTRLDKREGPDYTELWSIQKGYRPSSTVTISVSVEGDVIKAWVDSRQLFEVRDKEFRRGKVGLFCYAQSGQAFDDIRVIED
jgi:hypothetical protein